MSSKANIASDLKSNAEKVKPILDYEAWRPVITLPGAGGETLKAALGSGGLSGFDKDSRELIKLASDVLKALVVLIVLACVMTIFLMAAVLALCIVNPAFGIAFLTLVDLLLTIFVALVLP